MLIKSVLVSLALSAAPLWVTGIWRGPDKAQTAAKPCQSVSVVTTPSCCKTQIKPAVVTSTAPCQTLAAVTPLAAAVVPAVQTVQAEVATPHVAVWTSGDGSVPAVAGTAVAWVGDENHGGAWLGVQINEVPSALSAQLDLGGRGLIITNVVKDSPAEQAGLKPHDVLTSFDGQTVSGHAADLGRMVGEHEPGTDVTVGILRNGKARTLDVTLGSRPGQFAWRFDVETDDQAIEDTLHTTGRVILQSPEGKWIVKELDELDELDDEIKAVIPELGTTSTFMFNRGDGAQTIELHISRDGETIKVSRKDGGDITVTRNSDGEETVDVYENEDALRDGDEEAYNLFKGRGTHGTYSFSMDLSDLADMNIQLHGLDFDADTLKSHLHHKLGDAHAAYEDAMENLENLKIEIDDAKWADVLKNHNVWRHNFDSGAHGFAFHMGKPKHTFELKDDGTIEVRIREGDSELLRRFDGENDLADRNPRLYEKYQKLMAADQAD